PPSDAGPVGPQALVLELSGVSHGEAQAAEPVRPSGGAAAGAVVVAAPEVVPRGTAPMPALAPTTRTAATTIPARRCGMRKSRPFLFFATIPSQHVYHSVHDDFPDPCSVRPGDGLAE